jgi:Tfp pilus assembly protein PilE
MKKGISLIVLVITISVMLILLTIVVSELNSNNTIDKASEMQIKNDFNTFEDELEIFYSSCKMDFSLAGQNFDSDLVSAGENYATYGIDNMNNISNIASMSNITKIKDIIPSLNDKYINKLVVLNGKVTYIESQFDNEQKLWLDSINIPSIP